MQRPADAAIDISPVFADVSFLDKAAALGNFTASQIGIIAFQADALGAQLFKDKVQRRQGRLGDVSLPLVIRISNVPKLIFWQLPVGQADVDLGDKFSRFFLKGTQKKRLARVPACDQSLNGPFGFLFRIDQHQDVPGFVLCEVLLIPLADLIIKDAIARLVGTQKQALRFDVGCGRM